MINPDIKQLYDYKMKALERTSHPEVVKAIQFEMKKLLDIQEHLSKLEESIKSLTKFNRNLEEAKAIAEMICLIHGVPVEVIRDYYNSYGLEGTLNVLDQLTEENQLIVPARLKKHIK